MPNVNLQDPVLAQMWNEIRALRSELNLLRGGEYIAESGTTQAIQGHAVQDHAPEDGEGLFWVAGNSQYEPSAPPLIGCRLRNSADEATVNNTLEYLDFDTESYDTDGMHEGVTNPSRITIKTAGVYAFGAVVKWEANATGQRLVLLYMNRTTLIDVDERDATPNGRPSYLRIASTREFAVTDYIEVRVRQTSGGDLNVESASDYAPVFWAYKIGDPT